MTVAATLREAALRLAAVSDTPRLDAELLMAHLLGATRTDMLLRRMGDATPPGFAGLIERRLAHVPVAYILGRQEFWGLDLAIIPGVLIPRSDSETVVRAALAAKPDARRVLDLGTGSGALLLAVLSDLPLAHGIGIDSSPDAARLAAANASKLGFAGRAQIVGFDWNRADRMARLGRFDLVLANPPYVEDDADLARQVRDHEPHEALFAGADGLDAYRLLLPQLPALLEPGGVAVFEIGATQAEAMTLLAQAAKLSATLHHDLGGRPRALELARPGEPAPKK